MTKFVYLAGILFLLISSSILVKGKKLPSLYEYFTNNNSSLTGLRAANQRFTLNGKEIRIISGAIHYFRVHPDLWRDRLRKLRALGANTVESYIAWNLHEPRKGQFDFGEGNNDFSQFTNFRRFIKIAQEEDLLVILRPGPYISAEWDFGGLPSWLQRDPDMKVRENNVAYLTRVRIYFDQLLPLISDLQFTRGGPVISLQIENEYSSFAPRHKEYLYFLQYLYDRHGLSETLYLTCDNGFAGNGLEGTLPGLLQTANFQYNPGTIFGQLKSLQPDMPLLAMEFWSGWFNHWGDTKQNGTTVENFRTVLKEILGTWNASVNFYMFHGGTNFGFISGGNTRLVEPYIASDTTSYDYNAPLTEAGDYTIKYDVAAELISQYAIPRLRLPSRPSQSRKIAYPAVTAQRYLTYSDIVARVPSSSRFFMEKPVSMENLPMNQASGQSFGYVIYRTYLKLSPNTVTTYQGSYPRDIGYLIVDGELVSQKNETDYWINSVRSFPLQSREKRYYCVDLMVESMARANYGSAIDFIQQKGMAPIHHSSIYINNEEISWVEIIAAEFSNSWVQSLQNFREVQNDFGSGIPSTGPALIQFVFTIADQPADTFIDMSKWNKGILFVNGFNIGKYWRIGPQQHLYVPAPLLRCGENKVTVFEHIRPRSELKFSSLPNLGEPPS